MISIIEWYHRGANDERKAIREFMEASIASRRAWAESEAGRAQLGSGSPTIPGLSDLQFILEWLKARDGK